MLKINADTVCRWALRFLLIALIHLIWPKPDPCTCPQCGLPQPRPAPALAKTSPVLPATPAAAAPAPLVISTEAKRSGEISPKIAPPSRTGRPDTFHPIGFELALLVSFHQVSNAYLNL